jgi:type II secretory ATPase GspE/PulE/Tfp pilus assembly ATPase PilB-like protein
VLRGAVAQRLVRKLCPKCAKKRQATKTEQNILKYHGIRTTTVSESNGCASCGGTGFKGRSLIAETFVTDPGLEELILENARISELKAYLADTGMTRLSSEAARKIAEGETTFAEASREVILGEGDK